MVPLNADAVFRVAELPTCQKMLQALALLVRTTALLTAVVSVDGIWKMNTPSLWFWPLSVTVPDIPSDTGAAYNPGVIVIPPISAGSGDAFGRATAFL